MSARYKMLLAVSLTAAFTYAHAQSTLGELLDAGAKKLTKEQIVSAMAGTKITGPTSSGRAEMNIDLNTDGTLSGYLTSLQGGSTSGTIGKWTVDTNGKACIDERLTAWNMNHQECWFSYVLGEEYFRTVTDSEDRDTKVVKKSTTIVKKAN